MRKLTETDVRWLAKGYWGNYFNWRIHPKARPAFIVSGIALLVLAILAAVSIATVPVSVVPDGATAIQTNSIPSAAMMLTVLVFVASLLWGFFIYSKERDDFVDLAIQQWEKDETLPDRDAVAGFINKGG